MRQQVDMRKISSIIFGLALVVVVLFHSRAWFSDSSPKRDFDSYYCGAKVVLERRDPYLVEPLRTCEANIGKISAATPAEINAFYVTPTPLPGYDLLLLAPLAELPYKAARIIFGLTCLAAGVIIAFCVSRLSPIPFLPAIAICYFAINFGPMGNNGSIACISICCIGLAAVLVRDGRIVFALLALGLAMIQPQIAVFSIIASFLFFPKCRWLIVCIVAALCLMSVAALGMRGNIEYLRLLPLHASSEVLSPFQGSFAGLLASIGIEPSVALTCGTAWSIIMLVSAVIVVKNMSRSETSIGRRDAYTIIIPTAFAAFGGTFIHETQMDVVLLPAVCFVRPRGHIWIISALALGALVVPIEEIGLTHQGLPMLGIFILALASAWLFIAYLSDARHARSYANIVTPVLAIYLILAVITRPAYHEVSVSGFGIQGSQLASTAWALFQAALIAANNNTPYEKIWHLVTRVSYWFSIVVVIISTIRGTRRVQIGTESDGDSPLTGSMYA